jgi:hypothetical protein
VRSTRCLNHVLEHKRSEPRDTDADRDVTDLVIADNLIKSHRFPKTEDLTRKFHDICSNLPTTLAELRHTDKSRLASYVTNREVNCIEALKCSSGCT